VGNGLEIRSDGRRHFLRKLGSERMSEDGADGLPAVFIVGVNSKTWVLMWHENIIFDQEECSEQLVFLRHVVM
jgi:hypothetical protein